MKRLTRLLHSPSPVGRILRVLVRRVRHPEAPYSAEDLETLLLLSVAEAEGRKQA